jgi:hypothetical protein
MCVDVRMRVCMCVLECVHARLREYVSLVSVITWSTLVDLLVKRYAQSSRALVLQEDN